MTGRTEINDIIWCLFRVAKGKICSVSLRSCAKSWFVQFPWKLTIYSHNFLVIKSWFTSIIVVFVFQHFFMKIWWWYQYITDFHWKSNGSMLFLVINHYWWHSPWHAWDNFKRYHSLEHVRCVWNLRISNYNSLSFFHGSFGFSMFFARRTDQILSSWDLWAHEKSVQCY